MIPCPTCEKFHRDQDKLDLCAARAARRAEREEKRAADYRRRWQNQADEPVWDYIKNRRRSLMTLWSWDQVVAGLNRDYLPPFPGGRWTVALVVQLDSLRFSWGPSDTVPVYRAEAQAK